MFAMFHLFFVLRARTPFVDLDRVPHLVSRGGGGSDINRPLPGHIEVKRPVIHSWCAAGLSLDGSHVMRHRHRWHASVHHELGIFDGLWTVFLDTQSYLLLYFPPQQREFLPILIVDSR